MTAAPFAYKTQPYEHQRDILRRMHNLYGFGLLWEMGVGKTKPSIDLAAYLAQRNSIGGVIVVAPNGVHTNWVTDELPTHFSIPYQAHPYYITQAGQVEHEKSLRKMLHADFPVLTLSYHALLNERLLDGTEKRDDFVPTGGILMDFIKKHRPIVIYDESSKLKNPKGKMAMRGRALSRYSEWKRILEGTPVTNGPTDLYSQFMLLDENFWNFHGISTFTAFKNEFTIQVPMKGIVLKKKNGEPRKGKFANPMRNAGPKNLDKLYRLIEPVSHRLLKEDVLDLPPKTYQYRPFQLSPRQREVYEKLRKEYMVLIDNNLITAEMPIVRVLRLHQVTSNYLPSESGEEDLLVDPSKNPRLEALEELCEEVPHQCIIWARFKKDSEFIAKMLDSIKRTWVRYDGDTSDAKKTEAVASFKGGQAQFIIGRTQSGLARGQTLVCAKTVIYYNNTFALGDRLQSEDRAHRIGQTDPVLYWDLVAERTVDRHIVDSLRSKFDIAAQVTQDQLRDWLQ